jgi:DNA-binding MarR family transcriptional regulator
VLPTPDPLLHAPARLHLAVLLEAAGDRDLTFPALQQMTGMTAGNLSTHLRRLEEAGYVAVTKGYDVRTPVTRVRATTTGLDRLEGYRQDLTRVLDGELAASMLAEVER